MSNTILELIRSKNEELEHLEKALAKTIAYKDNNPKDKVTAELIIKKFVDEIQKRSRELLEINADRDGLKKEEIDILAGNKNYLDSNLNLLNNKISASQKTADVWYNFYQKIREIKIANKKILDSNANEINENINYEKMFNYALDEINAKPIFTAEENRGRCVDMNEIFFKYLNLKKLRESNVLDITDYLSFLSEFCKFHLIPLHLKKCHKYKDYINSILEYFKTYFTKTHPLLDVSTVQKTIDEGFEKEWKEGSLEGWEDVIKNVKNTFFESDGKDKDHLDPLFCLACQRKFANESVFEHHKTGKSHLKKVDNLNKNSQVDFANLNISEQLNKYDSREEEICKEIAYVEYQILRYKDLLGDVFENTKNLIRKKQSMNYDEMEADIVDEKDLEKIEEEDEDEKPIYNPKNVPIGWDGKPIPYWLYKLHGLGVEYKCEICGNASYWGRKAFERHFQEWRHSYGMKCLKIPNTVHFKEVTSIEEALRLHQVLIENSKKSVFKPELEEEFEDSEGNPLNKKMYLDLKRQGIL